MSGNRFEDNSRYITLLESGRLYIQILNIEAKKTVHFFDDMLDKDIGLENFIIQAINQEMHYQSKRGDE